VGGVATGTTINGRGPTNLFRFAATKVPRQCPLVLLVTVGLVKVRRLEVEKVRWRVEQGEKLSRVLLRSYTILNFVISFGRAALGEILMLIWGATFGRNLDVNIGRATWEAYSAMWNLGTNPAFALGPWKTTENLDRVGQSQDLPNAYWLLASSPAFKYTIPNGSP
jgi:hypothetical protein